MVDKVPAWMRAICDSADEIAKTSCMLVDRPWSIEFDGARWLFATSNTMMAAIRSAADAPPCPPMWQEQVRAHLSLATPYTMPMDALRKTNPCAGCADCHGTRETRCKMCGGQGWLPNGDECRHCGSCERKCWRCSGTGRTACTCPDVAKPHLVAIGGVVFDAHLLWKALPHVITDACVVRVGVGTNTDPIVFDGSDWRIIVMPRLDVAGDATLDLALEKQKPRRMGEQP